MTKIEPPLVEGEWVVAETVAPFGSGKIYKRVEGTVVKDWGNGYLQMADAAFITLDGWTILERRPPEPDWADADAILVEWRDGSTVPFPKRDGGSFGFTSPAGWLEILNNPNNEIVGIRGLYLRDDS